MPAEGFELPFETCPLTEPRLWFRPGRPSWCAAGRSGWVLGTPLPEAAGTPPTGRPRAAKTELSPWPEGKVARLLRRSFDGRQAVVELVPAGAASEGAAELRLYDLQGERPADRGAIGALGEEQHVLALSAGAEAVALIARDRSGLQALAGGTDWWREHEYWSKAAFSPDGSILAAYGTIADPQLYHAADGRPLRNRSAPLKHLSALIWGPDGHLATLSESEQRLDFFKVRGEELWRTGMVLLEERTDFDFEQRSGFSADGRWFLVAGDLTRRTLVLPVTQGALLGEACRRLPSDLTLEVKRALELDPTARPCGERPAVAD